MTVTVSPSASGTVTKAPNQTQSSSGSTVQLTAAAASGYLLTRWEGNATGSTNPISVTMNGNKSVTAVFTASAGMQYNLTGNWSGTRLSSQGYGGGVTATFVQTGETVTGIVSLVNSGCFTQ